eukprot:1159616-Pelagomonas_calceolata.AAC.4
MQLSPAEFSALVCAFESSHIRRPYVRPAKLSKDCATYSTGAEVGSLSRITHNPASSVCCCQG